MTARKAYRATFEEYGRKARKLECLLDARADDQIATARADLEKARAAHSHARDELAKELIVAPKTAAAG